MFARNFLCNQRMGFVMDLYIIIIPNKSIIITLIVQDFMFWNYFLYITIIIRYKFDLIYKVINKINTMRSLIKMQVTRYPIIDISPTPKLPYNDQLLKKNTQATFSSSRPSTQSKRHSVCSNPNRSIFGQQSLSYSRIMNESEEKSKRLRTSQQKRCIQKFISGLAEDLEDPLCQPSSGQSKLKILKKIIENYDIKNLQKNQYSKLIKTFGLQIDSAKTANKDKSDSKVLINPRKDSYRKFNIKTNQKQRLLKLKNKIQNETNREVALLQFSSELNSQKSQPKMEKKKFAIKNNSQRLRININTSKNSSTQLSPKKVSPFKYRSRQDAIVQKVNKYRQFLFSLNYSNYLYRDLNIVQYIKPIKYYIGGGNNSNLVRSLMKKRHWFQETNKMKQANFVWTQLKVQSLFLSQPSNEFYDAVQIEMKQFHLQKLKQKKTEKTQRVIKSPQKQKKSIFVSTNKRTNLTDQNLRRIVTNKETCTILKFQEEVSPRKNDSGPFFGELRYCDRKLYVQKISYNQLIHNHLQSNGILGNKKGLFYCLREYYKLLQKNIWNILPMTFHIKHGLADDQYKHFLAYFQQRKNSKLSNCWIMKPGEYSNRGNGISCSNKLQQIKKRVMKCQTIKKAKQIDQKTLILQLYITNPLLYNGRKFDIRVFMLTTCHNGKFKAYWYQQGYARTSSFMFNINQISDIDIHLTNDAIQKQSDFYGKYQAGNKLSFGELQRYIDGLPPQGRTIDFNNILIPKMKAIAADALKSSFLFLDDQRRQNNFEIFGLDFMVDYNLNPWLIEINTNPCLQLSCPLLQRIIPYMLQNSLRIGVDSIFPPPQTFPQNYKYNIPENAAHYNKFQIIFDQDRDGPSIKQLYEKNPISKETVSSLMNIEQQKQVFEEEGTLCQYDL